MGPSNVGLYALLVVFSLLALVHVGFAQVYSLDTSKSYTRSAGYPLSCTCAEDGVSTANCDLFQCSCQCDVTAGECDFNCCCDPDCSAAQTARFAEVGCSTEGYTASATPLCYSSLELYEINPKMPLSGEPTAAASVGSALCVEKYNGADEIDFYTDASIQSNDIFTTAAGTKTYSYGDTADVSTALDSNFDKGDNIAAYVGVTNILANMYSTKTGYLSLPAADFTGKCNDYNFVEYEAPVDERSCLRELKNTDISIFSMQCETDFSVSHYAQELYVSSIASTKASDGAPSSVVEVQIGTITHESINSTFSQNVTVAWKTNSCHTKAQTSIANYMANPDGCFFAKNVDPYSTDIPVCQNMVKSVAYTVYHDDSAAGTITNVIADITITDVQADIADSANNGQMLTQSFSVSFVSAFSGTASAANGNIVTRSRSGNPGYIIGKPVLNGEIQGADSTTGLKTISQSIDGLQVPSSVIPFDASLSSTFGTGTCPQVGATKGYQQVGFGYDLSTGCELELTRPQLEGLCCTGSASDCSSGFSTVAPFYADATSGLPYFLNVTASYVGIFGNADPLDVSQWSTFTVRDSTVNRNWDAKTGICSTMKTGLAYKFLVASAGEKEFPQNKIIAGEVEIITSDWYSSVPYNDTLSTQSFPLTVTVSFVYKNSQDLEGYAPPAPPVLFKVPHDVFYPFFISPASSGPTMSYISIFMPIVCLLVMFM